MTPVETYTFDVTEEYLQSYYNSNCHPTTAKIGENNCMIAYNNLLHAIDLLDLDNRKPLKQIKLMTEGPDGVTGIAGIFYYKGMFVLQTSIGYCRVNMDGKVVSQWSKNEFLATQEGFTTMTPDLTMFFSIYSFMGFYAEQGLIAFPIYKMEKENGEYPKRIIVVSCEDWSVIENIDISYPEQMKKEEKLALLGSINVLPHGNEVIYNYPASSEVYVYKRTDKSTQSYTIPSQFTEPYYRIENPGNPMDGGLANGFYFPLRYDACRKVFWRIQQKPVNKEIKQGIAGKSFSITRIATNFKQHDEYLIPENQKIYPNLLFTDKMVLLPYTGGDKIGENNICFYGLESAD